MWHWAILLLLIGVPVFFATRSARKRPRPPKDLEGFGGWLMLLAIGQSLSPLRTLLELARSVKDYQRLITLPNGPLAVYGEAALNLALSGASTRGTYFDAEAKPALPETVYMPMVCDPSLVHPGHRLDIKNT